MENLLVNGPTGQVVARSTDWLHFAKVADAGPSHVNEGDVFLDNGTMQFDHILSNGSTGRILGRGELFLRGGMTSTGLMHLNAGVADIHGNVDLLAGSRTIVSAGGTATFFGNVSNQGDLFVVREGAAAVFVGSLSGKGISGPGQVIVGGLLLPGNSPGLMEFGGTLRLGSVARLVLEIDGRAAGLQHDRVTVPRLVADGELAVLLGSAYADDVRVGDCFRVFDFSQSEGEFSRIDLPVLAGYLTWQTSRLLQDGWLHIVSRVMGDADANGVADLADFNRLKSNFGAVETDWSRGDFDLDGTSGLADFSLLKGNFGMSAMPAPEPAGWVLAVVAAGCLGWGSSRCRAGCPGV